jgi:hypothetical protein
MHTTFKLVLATVTGASLSLLAAPSAVMADDVPDALSVEWQGKKPCEKLFEDAQVRIARCTFPPGAVHACPPWHEFNNIGETDGAGSAC